MPSIRSLVLITLSICLLGCRSSSTPTDRVELPVTEQPDRASNQALLDPESATDPVASGARPRATTDATAQAAEAPTAVTGGYGSEAFRLVNQSDEIVSVLKNGMVVIAKRVPSPVMAVRGYVRTGGVYEGKWLGGGLSHLLEHLVAGGSSERRDEAANRDLLQRIGNNSNAYTTQDHTAYFINTTPDHLGEAVDLVTGWMLGAKITSAEYGREYEVVQRELEKDKGEPDWVFYQLYTTNRYRVSPARVPTIGYQEVIQGLSRDDVYSYYKQTYLPNNMVFSVAGDADPQSMLAAVQKQVAAATPGRVPPRVIEPEPPVLAPRTLVATFPKLGQAKLQLAFPSVKLDSPDLYALDLLSVVLGGGESSILVEELRDKQRLVTGVYAGNPTPDFVDGSFQIEMELPPDKIASATAATLAILDGVIKDGVGADRLQRAKAQMRADRVKGLQTSESMAAALATDFMNTGDPHFTDRYLKRIEQITSDEVREVAKRYLVRDALLTTALLPAEFVGAGGLPRAEDVLRPAAPTTKDSPAAVADAKVTRVELPNGAILLHKRIATSPLVVMKMFALGGVTAEDARTNGLGNLTMDMLPRGTKTRSAQQIAEFFDSIGGELDTTCGNNSWSWSATCLKGDFDKAMDVFADVVNNPAFRDGEIAPIKERVAAQIEGQDADWSQQAMRFFKKTFFGPQDSPYQFLPIGTKQNVATFTREQMQKFYNDTVMQSRRVIAIYGDVELDRAKAAAMEKLGSGGAIARAAERPRSDAATTRSANSASGTPSVNVERIDVQKTEQPLAGVVIGFDAQGVIGEPAMYPFVVADTMTSGFGYPTGYLHEILRGRGLVYMVHAVNSPGRSPSLPGTFYVIAGCDPSKVDEVIDVILENIARLQGSEQDTQPGWFERAKQLATTADALDNETPAEQAQTAALDEMMGLGYDYHDQFAPSVNAVKLDQVRDVAASRLNRAVVTVSTPAPDAVKVKPGARTYKTFPPVDLTPRGVQHDSK